MKIWNYMVIMTSIILLFELAGVPVASGLLNYLGISTTGTVIVDSGIYLAIFGLGGILIGLIGGLGIGFITKSQPENFIILPFVVGGALLFFSSFSGILLKASDYGGWIFGITTLVISPLGVGFVIGLIEFFRGTD